jgi:hypothetical protein
LPGKFVLLSNRSNLINVTSNRFGLWVIHRVLLGWSKYDHLMTIPVKLMATCLLLPQNTTTGDIRCKIIH